MIEKMFIKWRYRQSYTDELAKDLNVFAKEEKMQTWQLLQAISGVSDPKTQAFLFKEALQTTRNAHQLKGKSIKLSSNEIPDKEVNQQQIVLYEKDYPEFIANQTANYKSTSRRLLKSEEVIHDELTVDLLKSIQQQKNTWIEEYGTSNFSFKITGQKILDKWIALGKWMGNITFTILLSAIYLLGGVFLSRYCKNKMESPNLKDLIAELSNKNL